MKGAVTVNATSQGFSHLKAAKKVRAVKSTSAAARLSNAAFSGIQFLISTTCGRSTGDADAELGHPESTTTSAFCARWVAIATIIAAVVLWSGG